MERAKATLNAMNIEEHISHILSLANPSSGDNLTGFKQDSEYLLIKGVEEPDIVESNDPRCLIKISFVVNDHSINTEAIARDLRERWEQMLSYSAWKHHEIRTTNDQVYMRFATATGKTRSDIVVTGEVFVTGFKK